MDSLESISTETVATTESWTSEMHARLEARNYSELGLGSALPALRERAQSLTVYLAVADWNNDRMPCSAEDFVPRFYRCMWNGVVVKGTHHQILLLPPS